MKIIDMSAKPAVPRRLYYVDTFYTIDTNDLIAFPARILANADIQFGHQQQSTTPLLTTSIAMKHT